MTTRLYPDINIVHLLRTHWTPPEFDRRARARGVTLTVGMHVIYELARGFVKEYSKNEIRAACHFLSELREIEYLPQAQALIRAELSEALLGVPIITVLSPLNQFSTRLEVTRLASGYGEQAATFIAQRETSIGVMNPRIATANRRDLRIARKMDFEAFRDRLRSSAPETLRRLAAQVGNRVSAGALSRILAHPLDFPTLTTWLNAQWYMGWVAVHHSAVPGKLDDFRHLVESATCDGFVTNEGTLRKVLPRISPSRPCLSWQDLLEILT